MIVGCCSFVAQGQFKALFYIDTVAMMVASESFIGAKAMQKFWIGDYDSALLYMDSLSIYRPNDPALKFDKTIVYAQLHKTNEFKKNISLYIEELDTNAVCTCLERSEYYAHYRDKNWFKAVIQKCWKLKQNVHYSNPKLSDQLLYLKMVDQDALINKGEKSERYHIVKDSLLLSNLNALFELIDTTDLPSRSEVGTLGCDAVWIIFLHIDFDPGLQYRMGQNMLSKLDSYSPYMVADLIDRALLNWGRPQKYGYFSSKLLNENLDEINKNRLSIGLEKIEK